MFLPRRNIISAAYVFVPKLSCFSAVTDESSSRRERSKFRAVFRAQCRAIETITLLSYCVCIGAEARNALGSSVTPFSSAYAVQCQRGVEPVPVAMEPEVAASHQHRNRQLFMSTLTPMGPTPLRLWEEATQTRGEHPDLGQVVASHLRSSCWEAQVRTTMAPPHLQE